MSQLCRDTTEYTFIILSLVIASYYILSIWLDENYGGTKHDPAKSFLMFICLFL